MSREIGEKSKRDKEYAEIADDEVEKNSPLAQKDKKDDPGSSDADVDNTA